MRLLSAIKNLIVPSGSVRRVVPFGVYRGLSLELDLRIHSQLYLGLWERETYPSIRRGLHQASWLIDVGAGRGELCLYALRRPNVKRVYAIEPQQREIEMLVHHLSVNGFASDARLTVLDCLAGDSDGAVRLETLDLPQGAGFIKIDVDGAEMAVLKGARELLRARPLVVLVETHSVELEQAAVDCLSAQGLTCRILSNAWWRAFVPEQRPIAHNRWIVASGDCVT